MTNQRAAAYRRVTHTIREVGPAKLLAAEQRRLRDAADALLFSTDLLGDPDARRALEDAERLCRDLVDSGRWQEAGAMRLADDVAQCGPSLSAHLEAA